MKRKEWLISALLMMCGTVHAQYEVTKAMIADMNLGEVSQSYGAPLIKGNVLMTQAPCTMKIRLSKASQRFTTKVKIADAPADQSALTAVPLTDGTRLMYAVKGDEKEFAGVSTTGGDIMGGSVVIVVKGDGKELLRSDQLTSKSPLLAIDLPLKGVEELQIEVTDGGDGPTGDMVSWEQPTIEYYEIAPAMVKKGVVTDVKPLLAEATLLSKVKSLPKMELPFKCVDYDWLNTPQTAKAVLYQMNEGKELVLTNGLVSRHFRITPNLATIDIVNQMKNSESLLRAVSSEGEVTIDGKVYSLGGLVGQEEYGYTLYKWVDELKANAESFRVIDYTLQDYTPTIAWPHKRWALEQPENTQGKHLTFTLQGPDALQSVKVKLHYVLYDGLPAICKWMEVVNESPLSVVINSFKLEQLAMAEPESPVEHKDPERFRKPNIHVQSDWSFLGFTEREAERTEFWEKDSRYTSQCNYPMITPCMLEVRLPMGPNETVAPKATFTSFKNWVMPFDSDDRERKGLFERRMLRKIAPWTTENPIFMHCTSSDEKVVREAIDQCVATGYEMVILSFGSGLNMENESPENIAKFKGLVAYAHSKGIELGGYSLLSSRWISDEVDVVNPETGKRGGMIFGSSPCLCSEWGKDYFRKIKGFFEQTGMNVFENDGSYPGNVCASTTHAYHKGLADSQWEQRKRIVELYQWMCEQGIYTNIPDYGYMLNGGTKVGIGYREVNWSLPRERQLVLGRQVMYDGLWERLPSMCWTFVPLTQYHGGGAAATLEPLKDHLGDYKAHMMQNYGSGVQACYRGHRLFDSEETKEVVKGVVDWYKQYRSILNSELIHLRRPDGKDWDGILHVNPELKEKGLVMLYNPTDKEISRTIKLPLYYTGLREKASMSWEGKRAKSYKLGRDYCIEIEITIPAQGYTWGVIE